MDFYVESLSYILLVWVDQSHGALQYSHAENVGNKKDANVLTLYVQANTVLVMAFNLIFNEEKNQLLKATRGVGFDEVMDAICEGDLLADITHPSQKRSNQRVYIVRIKKYAYAVPYVINASKHEIFLKTVYPSRSLTRKYIKGDDHV